jgi:hypothetical protein
MASEHLQTLGQRFAYFNVQDVRRSSARFVAEFERDFARVEPVRHAGVTELRVQLYSTVQRVEKYLERLKALSDELQSRQSNGITIRAIHAEHDSANVPEKLTVAQRAFLNQFAGTLTQHFHKVDTSFGGRSEEEVQSGCYSSGVPIPSQVKEHGFLRWIYNGPVMVALSRLAQDFEAACSYFVSNAPEAKEQIKRVQEIKDVCADLRKKYFVLTPTGGSAIKDGDIFRGDYATILRFFRSPIEGNDLFSTVLNMHLLSLEGATSYRNRVVTAADILVKLLERHHLRELARKQHETNYLPRRFKVKNYAGGPAFETCLAVQKSPYASYLEMHYFDANPHALAHAQKTLRAEAGRVATRVERRTAAGKKWQVNRVPKSDALITEQPRFEFHQVNPKPDTLHFLKAARILHEEGGENGALNRELQRYRGGEYDLIFCNGLWDYLNPRLISAMIRVFDHELAPGGVLVGTNLNSVVDPSLWQREAFLDWSLNLRSAVEFINLVPQDLPGPAHVRPDQTGVNLFLLREKSVVGIAAE